MLHTKRAALCSGLSNSSLPPTTNAPHIWPRLPHRGLWLTEDCSGVTTHSASKRKLSQLASKGTSF
eukprot:6093960-Alexandrium_andersonii.AAC.1